MLAPARPSIPTRAATPRPVAATADSLPVCGKVVALATTLVAAFGAANLT